MRTLKLRIKGKVQGVFFRANVSGKASELGLFGYAKNLPNGDVELLVQGVEEQVSKLFRFIKSNPGSSRVDAIEIEKLKEHPERFTSFGIR